MENENQNEKKNKCIMNMYSTPDIMYTGCVLDALLCIEC